MIHPSGRIHEHTVYVCNNQVYNIAHKSLLVKKPFPNKTGYV